MVCSLMIYLLLALPVMAVAQDVVKVNILEIAAKIPAPPKDVTDAFSRTTGGKDDPAHDQRKADGFYKPVVDQLESTNKQIQKAIELLSKPQIDAATQMDQKEMQKKFKSMSKEDQMKMAMEMSKTMGMGSTAMTPESQSVMAAQQECNRINEELGKDVQTWQAGHEAREKMTNDRNAKHSEIQAWQEEQAKKLPQINYGEMSGPEPKADYELRTKAMQKHLATENEFLKAVQKEWKAAWDKYNARFSPLQDKLAKIRYGEDAKNPTTKRQLLTAQGQMVASTGDLTELSRNSTEGAAEWWQRKLDLEKRKPKD